MHPQANPHCRYNRHRHGPTTGHLSDPGQCRGEFKLNSGMPQLTPQSLRTAELIVGTLSLAGQEGRRLRLKEEELRGKRQKQRREEELGERLRQ